MQTFDCRQKKLLFAGNVEMQTKQYLSPAASGSKFRLNCGRGIEFAFALSEKEVGMAPIIGRRCLCSMTEAGHKCDDPDRR